MTAAQDMLRELRISVLENIVLHPLRSGSSQSAIGYELSPEAGQPFDHLRFRRGQIVNSAIYHPRAGGRPGRRLPGTSLYGGVLFSPFGHFIAESLHRLWPALADPALAEAPIVFHSTGPGLGAADGLPAWAAQIFAMLGIGTDRLTIVEEAIEAERLLVPQQASLLGQGPLHAGYAAVFPPPRPDARIARPRRGHLYVSRSRYLHKGSYLGEVLVEQVLAESGRFRIIHPQDHAVHDVVDALESSESAVFAEGSAIHVLELCREKVPRAFVILRRQRKAFDEYFSAMLAGKAEQVRVAEARAFLTPLGWSPQRQAPLGQNASAVQALAALLEDISGFCGVPLRKPSDMEERQAAALSLAHLVLDPRATTGMGQRGPEQLLSRLQDQVQKLDILPFDIPERGPRTTRGADDDAARQGGDAARRARRARRGPPSAKI